LRAYVKLRRSGWGRKGEREGRDEKRKKKIEER
jgi:hypothetical protein